MKSKQIWLITGLILTLLVSAAGTAGAQVLNNASQIVNLDANGPNPITLNTFSLQNPDGSSTSNWTIPANKVLVITKVKYSFTSSAGDLTGPVTLAVGQYYKKRSSSSGPSASDNDNLPTGFVIDPTGWNSNSAKVSYPNNGSALPGTLNIILNGFTAPNQ